MDTSSLMEQILSSDNLNRAYLQVVRNKGAEGVDGMKYTELKEYLAKNGEIIKEQLRMRKYKPQPVRRVEIPKPDGGVRNLGVPTVTDRFIQQAIAQVLTPIYEEQFNDHSYGFRPNKCAQQAILTALDMMNEGNDWIVDIDLEKFFDTVNHDKLMTIIGRTIKDGDVISIVRKYLVSGIMIDDEYEDSIVGTPQGGNLSPLLANIMLNELDKEMEKRGLNFVRYADDCIIMVGSEMSANRVMRNISRFIEEKLLKQECSDSIFAKAYIEHSSIVKNAKAHMYNDIFLFFDVKDFFPSISHNYLIQRLYKELNNNGNAGINSCSKLVELCSVNDKGLPLGLVTSPILSNIYMKEFDNIIYGKLKKMGLDNIIYTRYADDIVISFKAEKIDPDINVNIKECVIRCLKQVHLKSNENKERVYDIRKGGHVRITGINVIVGNDNYRKLTVGRKRKDRLYNDVMSYYMQRIKDREKALSIKGNESFILSVEGKEYEKCYSENMKKVIKEYGYDSLHDMIRAIKY